MQLINEATKDKLRGGFYTPEPIAEFMLKWATNGNQGLDILEPSCGDGVFLQLIKNNEITYNSITAVEFDDDEFTKAEAIELENSNFINDDFHRFCLNTDTKYDLVIGNPPYIRYQYFSKEQQELAAEIFSKSNLKYSKLTNAWVSFVVGSSQLLKEEGKIAFVLPAEVLQVSYAQQLREFLAHFYNKINIISFEKLVFPEIQQEVVLLLCEKDGTNLHKIDHLEVKDAEDLKDIDILKLDSPQKKIDFKSNKWTFYFLDQIEIDFLEKLQKNSTVPKLGKYANVEVGITTGANPFFTVPLSTIQFYDLEKYAKPLVGRSVQVPSLIFTEKDWKKSEEFAKEYTSNWDWNYGKSPQFDMERSERLSIGTVEVKMDILHGNIEKIYLYGDFFGMGEIKDVEKQLTDIPYTKEALNEALNGLDLVYYFGGDIKEELIDLLY